MIAYLKGQVLALDEQSVTILAGPVGYAVKVTPKTLVAMQKVESVSADAELWIHHRITELSQDLYGFLSPNDMKFFHKLLPVQGVGPKVALTVSDHADAVYSGDLAALKALNGIGEKTAKNILTHLDIKATAPGKRSQVDEIALSPDLEQRVSGPIQALVGLGYKPLEARKMVTAVTSINPSLVDEGPIIKLALQNAPKK
jgi:Holliday junction DNA helicase RuvA